MPVYSPPCSMLMDMRGELRALRSEVRAGGPAVSPPPSLAGPTPRPSCDGGATLAPTRSTSLASGSVEGEQSLRGFDLASAGQQPAAHADG